MSHLGIKNLFTDSYKAMAPHSSTLAWKIPWLEESGRLQSMGSLRVGHDWATSLWLFTFMHWRRKWQPTPVFAWRIPRTGEPGGLPSMGSHRVGHDWSDLAAGYYRVNEWRCSVMSDSAIPWTIAYQVPPSLKFSRQNTGVGCHFLL